MALMDTPPATIPVPPDWSNGTAAGDQLRRFLATGYDDLAVMYCPDPDSDLVLPPRSVASLLQAWGAAPYVGDPFVYRWQVAVDQGVSVASSPAVIVWLPLGREGRP